MQNADVKKAVELAEKELKDKQIDEVKEIVKETLTKIDVLKDKRIKLVEQHKKELNELDETSKYLKMDLDDLKDGRLDRIEERQKTDSKAKDISVVIVYRENNIFRPSNDWYYPYNIVWQSYVGYYGDNINTCRIFKYDSKDSIAISNSIAKDNAVGSYIINGKTINFR